jgi:hypothetical protein
MTVRSSDSLSDGDIAQARQALEIGEPLEVRTTRVLPVHGLAAIAIVSAGPEYDVAMWALQNRDAIFSERVRGTRLGLRTPLVRLENVVPESPDDTLVLRGRYFNGRYELRAMSSSVHRVRELAASPSLTWALLLPIPLYALGNDTMLLTAVWLAIIWLVVGYWSGRAMWPVRLVMSIEVGVAIIIGLGVVPNVFALPVAHWSEWLATIVAAGVGSLSARRMATPGANGARSR